MQLSRFPGPLASNPSSAPATPALVVLRVLTQTVNLLLVIVRETLETALRTGTQKTIVVGVDHLSIDQSSAESPSKVELKDSQDCPLMPGAKRHPLSARAVEPECLTGPAPPMGMAWPHFPTSNTDSHSPCRWQIGTVCGLIHTTESLLTRPRTVQCTVRLQSLS